MASIAELLENELKAALEIKNEQSLHNYVTILVESLVKRDQYMTDSSSMKGDIRAIVDAMREGFRRMDERFEAVDKRFEAVDKRFEAVDKRFDDLIGQMNSRFNMMFFFVSGGFTILTVLLTLYRFIG